MDQDIRKMVEENNTLLKEQMEVVRDNQKKIKKIQAYIRRTMIAKWAYWILIITITFGAFYFSKPYIENAVDTYNTLKENVDRSQGIINDPGSLFKDVNLIEQLIGS